MIDAGIDVLTGGNHSWDVRDNEAVFERANILRPHNMIAPTGRGVLEMSAGGETRVPR